MYYTNYSLTDIENEIWEDIPNYEGMYQVSNMGRIKSLRRKVAKGHGGSERIVMELIRRQPFDKDGYLMINLAKNNFTETKKVHRLVGELFIDNINGKPEINHKYGIKTDNRASELEWNTPKENTTHSFQVLKRESGRKGKINELNVASKKVHCSTLDISFPSASEAHRQLGISGITEVCNGNLRHTNGLVFRYI